MSGLPLRYIVGILCVTHHEYPTFQILAKDACGTISVMLCAVSDTLLFALLMSRRFHEHLLEQLHVEIVV